LESEDLDQHLGGGDLELPMTIGFVRFLKHLLCRGRPSGAGCDQCRFGDHLGDEPPAWPAGRWPRRGADPAQPAQDELSVHHRRAVASLRCGQPGARLAQHFGRPSTPNDQDWIESFFDHLKREFPHLEKIKDAGELERALDRLRVQYNTVRLSQGVPEVLRDVACSPLWRHHAALLMGCRARRQVGSPRDAGVVSSPV